MKVCPKCGNLVADNLNFCMKCGTSVQFPNPQPKVQPQQPKAEIPVNNAYVPQVKQEKKKNQKKKNSAAKIIAIILAVILLVGGVVALIIGISNSNETKGEGVKYIEDFPVLKNAIELMVYDADIFPVEEYEIKVEKFAVGGALKDISMKKEILDEISSEPVYDLNLEDGSYRITLTDTAEVEEDTTAESSSVDESQTQDETFKKVVIDVKVDEKDEKATDKADLKSKGAEVENSYNMIEATDEDLERFENFLNETLGRTMQNSEESFDTVEDVLLMMECSHSTAYSFFFGYIEYEQFSTGGIYEVRLPKENIRWLCENIFNVEYREELIYNDTSGRYEGSSRFSGDYFYVPEWAATGVLISKYELVSHDVVDGKYHMIVDVTQEQWETDDFEYAKTLKIIAEIKVIDGERYWSICEIEEYDPSTDTQQTTEQTVDKLSADDIINVYMNNKSVWYRDFENFECDGYSSFYSFIDLDFDGIPELLTTGMGGSGRYSSNKFYKLNANKDGIEEITYNVGSESMYDFYSPEVRPQLLKNSQNNSYLYWGSDFINAGRYGSGFTYGKLEYKGGKITQTEMFSTGSSFEGGVESTYYDLIEGSDYNDVSESEYNREYNAFMADYTNVNLQMEYISAQEFAGASQSQQKELFKNALKAYNYNGYVSLVE